MTLKFTERDTGTTVVTTELNSLADDTAALISTALSNDASTERDLFADFSISLAVQGSARDASAQVSLMIVPEIASAYGDVSGADVTANLKLTANYIARAADGTAATFDLDAAVTARVITVAGIQIPNANYKVGLLNETGQALAATGNTITKSGNYSSADV